MSTYLFDFDGTLVDSMPVFISAMLKILDENKATRHIRGGQATKDKYEKKRRLK